MPTLRLAHNPTSPPGARQSNHDGAGEMPSGLARLPFVRSPLLDERVCPLQKHVAMTRAGKDDIRSRCTAPEQHSEWALRQREFVVQVLEMSPRLLFRRPTEPAGVVVNHNTLALENQRLDFRTKDELGGPGLRVPQIGALDSVVGAYVDPQVEPPHPVFLGVLRWFTKRAPVCLTNAINARDTLVREVPKERVVATPNPELEVLQRELALVRQDSDGVRRDNEWLKSLAATRRGFRDPNNWTLAVTIVMLVLVGVYTHAAKEQVKAAHAQTESSVENMLRPVVVLAPHDDFSVNPNQTTVVIRNIGFGPALNAVTSAVVMDRARRPVVMDRARRPVVTDPAKRPAAAIPLCLDVEEPPWENAPGTPKATLHFNHRTVIAANETQNIDGEERIEGGPTFKLTRRTCKTEPYTQLTPVQSIEGLIKGEKAKSICIAYRNAASERYETWQKLYRPSESQPQTLAIDYICQRKTPSGEEQCTGPVGKACKGIGGLE
jgi:hypothetical protein